MRTTRLLLCAALALPAAAQDAPAPLLVVRAEKAHLGDGRTIEGGVRLQIRSGKIESLGPDRGPLPAGARVVDARGKVLLPGLVAARTDLVEAGNDPRSVAAQLEAAGGLDLAAWHPDLLRGGITTVHVAPGRNRFLPGLGAVAKLAPRGGSGRILNPRADLLLVLGEAGKAGQPLYDPELFPDEDRPLLPARRLEPASLAAQGALARRLLVRAADPKEPEFVAEGSNGWSLVPLRGALKGTLPVRFLCDGLPATLLALDLAAEHGFKAILELPQADPEVVAPLAKARPQAVILPLSLRLWAPNAALPPAAKPDRQPDPGLAGRLHAAGVPVILCPAADGELDVLLLAAGVAVRAGLDPAAALRGLTLEAARTLGVAARIGSLEAGKDGDFVILSGEPFDARSAVEAVYVDGLPAWEGPPAKRHLAVRAARLHAGDGRVLEPAVLLLREGKIVAVGTDLSLPPGTEVISLPGAVVTPGFLDADSRLGLLGEQQRTEPRQQGRRMVPRTIRSWGPLRLGPEADPAEAVDLGDPGFAAAAGAGVTALLLAGDGGTGRGSLLKAAGPDGEQRLVDRIAALNFALAAPKALEDQVAKAEAYVKKWSEYEKEYEAWRNRRFGPASRPAKPFRPPTASAPASAPASGPAAAAPAGAPPKPEPGKADPVTGEWKGEASLPDGKKAPCTLKLKLEEDGVQVSGTFAGPFRIRPNTPPVMPVKGDFRAGKLTVALTSRDGQAIFKAEAEVKGEEMEGTWELAGGRMKGAFTARKQGGTAGWEWSLPAGGGDLPPLDELLELDDDPPDIDPDLWEAAFRELPLLPVPDPFLPLPAGDPVSGTWEGSLEGLPGGRNAGFTANLSLQGETVTGTITSPFRRQDGPAEERLAGTFSGGTLRLRGQALPIQIEATVGADRMDGNWSLGPFRGTFSANRTAAGAPAGPGGSPAKTSERKSPPGGPPAPPPLEPTLEPWRRVLAGKAALVLHGGGPEALLHALELLGRKKELKRLVVADGPAAREQAAEIARAGAAVLVRPGAPFTPAWAGPVSYAEKGIPVLLGSGTAPGARWLPLQAAYAVARGLSPAAALQALTAWPARYLDGTDRLGLLAPGRDGDLLVWSGDPFDLESRLLLTVVAGKVVHKAEEGR